MITSNLNTLTCPLRGVAPAPISLLKRHHIVANLRFDRVKGIRRRTCDLGFRIYAPAPQGRGWRVLWRETVLNGSWAGGDWAVMVGKPGNPGGVHPLGVLTGRSGRENGRHHQPLGPPS